MLCKNLGGIQGELRSFFPVRQKKVVILDESKKICIGGLQS